ncbi:MAG: hypothetical protein HY721_21430 [Planctomycetes bacterium]|nr:hypothetical protein [Planctomycetota bacterium]
MAKPLNPLKTCLNLRSKQMFYETESSRSPEHDAEVERLFGACDTAVFWCQCTQTARGPDDLVVGRAECCDPARKCFSGLQSLA